MNSFGTKLIENKELVVIICGSRDWFGAKRIRSIYKVLSQLPKNTLIVHGACRGVDLLAEDIAKSLGFKIKAYPAKWSEFKKQAGRIRNHEMLTSENPDLVIAFHDKIELSKGTKHMIEIACNHNVKTMLFME